MQRKIIPYILILIALLGFFSPTREVLAADTPSPLTEYKLLAPLPCEDGPGCVLGELKTFNASQENNSLGVYLNLMIKMFIGLCAVLAVVMIVVGGLEYMTSELVHSKEAGKSRITHAILGLIIALSAYALLYTINPDLLNKTDIPKTTESTNPTP